MKSLWIKVNPVMNVFIRDKQWKLHKDTEEGYLNGGRHWATLPQTKEHQEPPQTGRNQGRFFPGHCRDGDPATL